MIFFSLKAHAFFWCSSGISKINENTQLCVGKGQLNERFNSISLTYLKIADIILYVVHVFFAFCLRLGRFIFTKKNTFAWIFQFKLSNMTNQCRQYLTAFQYNNFYCIVLIAWELLRNRKKREIVWEGECANTNRQKEKRKAFKVSDLQAISVTIRLINDMPCN